MSQLCQQASRVKQIICIVSRIFLLTSWSCLFLFLKI